MAAYRGRSRTNTTRSRSRPIKDKNGYTQWDSHRFSKTFGRVTQRKLNRLNMQKLVYSWRTLGNLAAGKGNLFMSNWYNGTADFCGMPCYAFELNSCINNVNGQISPHSPMMVLTRNTDTPGSNYEWVAQSGYSFTANLNAAWQLERSAHGSTTTMSYPNACSILKWLDVRMDCFGCTANPTKFVIELCQFDDLVIPSYDKGSGDAQYTAFWDQQMRPFIYNPNMSDTGYGGMNRKLKKVLASKTVEINPTSSTENDADPHIESVKFFWKMNRICRYDWKDERLLTENPTMVSIVGNGAGIVAQGDNQNQVHPKARLFLLIRACKFVREASFALQTTATTPSINIQIRACHVKNT